jgi:hypothetical protein
MTMEEAIKRAIQKYWEGEEPETLNKLGERKYNKKYFDSVEEEHFPKEAAKTKKKEA